MPYSDLTCVQCDTPIDSIKCNPAFGWMVDFLNANATKKTLGVPQELTFSPVSEDVFLAFFNAGDQ